MISYPVGIRARTAMRVELEKRLFAADALDDLRASRTIRCASGDHAGMVDGCANGGLSCLCACHDKADPA